MNSPYDQHDPDDPLSLQTSPCINVDTSHYYISCLKKSMALTESPTVILVKCTCYVQSVSFQSKKNTY